MFNDPTLISYLVAGVFGVLALTSLVFAIYFFVKQPELSEDVETLSVNQNEEENIPVAPVQEVEKLIHDTIEAAPQNVPQSVEEDKNSSPASENNEISEEGAKKIMLHVFLQLPLGYKKQLVAAINDLNSGKKQYNVNFAYLTLLKMVKDVDERAKLAKVKIDYSNFNNLLLENFKG